MKAIHLIENTPTYLIQQKLKMNGQVKSLPEPFKGMTSTDQYYKLISEIDRKLKERGALFVLVYSFILLEYLNELGPEDKKGAFVNKLKRKTEDIFSICEGMILGFHEIVRNILEHSSSKKGAVGFRIYSEKDLLLLKSVKVPETKLYLDTIKKERDIKCKYIDINVFDISNAGIIDTYKNKIKHDIDIDLIDFFKKSEKTPLNSLENFKKSYGLLFFSNQVEANNGFFMVSSIENGMGEQYINFGNTQRNTELTNGTCYNIIFPLEKRNRQKEVSQDQITNKKFEPVRGFEKELLNYDLLQFEDILIPETRKPRNSDWLININLGKSDYCDEKSLESNFFEVTKKQHGTIFGTRNSDIFTFLIPNEAKNYTTNPGDLLRFFSKLQETTFIQNIIVILEDSRFLNNLFSPNSLISFPKPILVYYGENNYFRPFLLFGSDMGEIIHFNYFYLTLPNFISENHTAHVDDTSSSLDINFPHSNLFYSKTKRIKEFDSLLEIRGQKLYNYFLDKCLNTDIENSKIYSKDDPNFQGYKISNGHFRLGSKIHIKDFYYAKRLFQVSHTTYHIALQLAFYIKQDEKLNESIRSCNSLMIIGYAKYSELLIYKLKEFMEVLYPANNDNSIKRFSFNIFKDYDSNELLYKNEDDDSPCIIIVPISSTFSTSVKIKQSLKKAFPKREIIQPYINIINVADESFQNYLSKKIEFNQCIKLLQNNWLEPNQQNINNREILIKDYNAELRQKYFIQVFTEWHDIKDCSLCFGKNEPPLIETDKASVTPLLIFGEPVQYPPLDLLPAKQCQYFSKYHHFGHYRINKKDNIHFIDPIEFLRYNKDSIIEWFQHIKQQLIEEIAERKICIIAPDGKHNSKFAHLVNQELVNDTANVILFNAESDYISNFKEFYSDIISNAACIMYVDDEISTGNTYFSITQYLNACENRKFNYIITMISRVNKDVELELESSLKNIDLVNSRSENNILKSKKFHSFQQINIPTVISSHLKCPVCVQQENYLELAKISNLDPTEYYFYKKVQSLNRRSFLIPQEQNTFKGYDDRINVWEESPTNNNTIESFCKNPFNHISSLRFCVEEFLNTNLIPITEGEYNTSGGAMRFYRDILKHIKKRLLEHSYSFEEISFSVLKIISLPPFINQYKIRKAVFQHLETRLSGEFKRVNERNFTDQKFRRLKLYLKRLSSLKSNYLIKESNYDNLLNLYEILAKRANYNIGIDRLLEKRKVFILKIISYLKQNDISVEPKKEDIFLQLKKTLREPCRKMAYAAADVICGKYYYLFCKYNGEKEIGNNINEHELIYSARALKNIESLIKTRTDFHYYIASLIKEITKDNEVKSIYLERSLTNWYEKLRQTKGKEIPPVFRRLIRLIKLENTGILNKYSEIFQETILRKLDFSLKVNELKNVRDSISKTEKEFGITEKSAYYQDLFSKIKKELNINNYNKLTPLFEFLNVERETTASSVSETRKPVKDKIRLLLDSNEYRISESFFHYLMLMWLLYNDNKEGKAVNHDLTEKMKFINKRFIDILQISEPELEAVAISFVLYKQPDDGGKIDSSNVTTYTDNQYLQEKWDINDSFLQKFAKGIKLRDGGGAQNIIEFLKEDGVWKSLKRYYKLQENNIETEFIDIYQGDKILSGFFHKYKEGFDYFKEMNHVLFYRITQMDYFNTIDPETKEVSSEIRNKPQAVIVVASKKANFFMAEKIRYLLLLKKHLSGFFRHHYENDSFSAAVIEKDKNEFFKDLSHGVERYGRWCKTSFKKIVDTTENENSHYKKILEANKVSYEEYEISFDKDLEDKRNYEQLKNEFTLFYNLSLNEVSISKIIAQNTDNITAIHKELETGEFQVKNLTQNEIMKLIEDLEQTINLSGSVGSISNPQKFTNSFQKEYNNIELKCHPEILKIIFSEIIINIKKANKGKSEIPVTYSFVSNSQELIITISNEKSYNADSTTGYGTKMMNKMMRQIYDGEAKGYYDYKLDKYITILKFNKKIWKTV